MNPNMAGAAKKDTVTSLYTRKIEPLALDASEFVMRPKVIKQEMELQVLSGRTLRAA
jgi:hypothetical protein